MKMQHFNNLFFSGSDSPDSEESSSSSSSSEGSPGHHPLGQWSGDLGKRLAEHLEIIENSLLIYQTKHEGLKLAHHSSTFSLIFSVL